MGWSDFGNLRIGILPTLQVQISNRLGNMALLDASGEKVGLRFYVPRTGNIRYVTFRTGTVTTSDTLKVTIQTLDSADRPSGTSYGGSGSATVGSLASNTWYTVQLSSDASATAGDYVAVVIEFNSYVAGNLSIAGFSQNPNINPYSMHFTAGSWATLATWLQVFSLAYSDGTYYPINGVLGCDPLSPTISRGNQAGLRFSLPFTARLAGISSQIQYGSVGPYNWTLYDSNGVTLSAVNIDTSTSLQTNERMTYITFPGVTLTADSVYRIVNTVADTAGAGTVLSKLQVPTTSALGALDGGTEFQFTSRTSIGASFVDEATGGASITLILDQIYLPGGMTVHPGMGGGMRG